jgi:glycosyltransferase involved in cell wall biosynthesis
MVISSRYEPFGLVVNEAMLCGCPVVSSDKVGAVRDLIVPGQTGFVYPCGDVRALAAVLQRALADSAGLAAISGAARARIESWCPGASVAALVDAVVRGVASSGKPSRATGGSAAESSAASKPSLRNARRS